jgi:hypothetical protein
MHCQRNLFTTGRVELENLTAEIKRNEDEVNAIVFGGGIANCPPNR